MKRQLSDKTLPFDVLTKRPKMWVKVGNQDEIDVENITPGLRFLDEDSSPALTNLYTDSTSNDGSIYNTSIFAKNTVTARFWLHFGDWYDFKLAKHDIYKVFSTKEPIRIRTDASPATVKYVRTAAFDIKINEDGGNDSVFTISFDNPSGYQYSIVNSDVIKEYPQEVWQLGQNLPNGKDTQYQFINQSRFKIYNASDIAIDPYIQRHELKIIIKHNGGSFGISNKTTGDTWKFTNSTTDNDIIMIDGINTYLNGVLANDKTDYGYITLNTGWNDIQISGTLDNDITFSFPYIYLG